MNQNQHLNELLDPFITPINNLIFILESNLNESEKLLIFAKNEKNHFINKRFTGKALCRLFHILWQKERNEAHFLFILVLTDFLVEIGLNQCIS